MRFERGGTDQVSSDGEGCTEEPEGDDDGRFGAFKESRETCSVHGPGRRR